MFCFSFVLHDEDNLVLLWATDLTYNYRIRLRQHHRRTIIIP